MRLNKGYYRTVQLLDGKLYIRFSGDGFEKCLEVVRGLTESKYDTRQSGVLI